MLKRSRQLASAGRQRYLFGADDGPRFEGQHGKATAKALSESTPPKLRIAFAQSFCATAIARYWERLHSRRGRPLRAAPEAKALDRVAMALAASLGEEASTLDVGNAAYLIGSTYAAMLPPEFRSKHGVFYTPPPVVDRLLDAATEAGVDWSKCRALDPACGGGAFLGPLAERMIAALKGCERRVIARNIAARLRGYERDAFAAWMSQVFLDATVYTAIGGSALSFDAIDVCDSLMRDEPADFDLVVGNPPYGRVTLTADQRATYKRSLYGHANLYGVFLDLAIRKAKQGGVIAYVTPTSFLSGEYFKRLRSLLISEASPVSLDFVSERVGVFDDVLQETLLAVYRRDQISRRPEIRFLDARGASVASVSAGKLSLPKDTEEPWLLPRSVKSVDLAKNLQKMPDRLASWGYAVRTGPLVWNRYKDQLQEKPAPDAVPLIWAEAVGADGTFCFRADRRNHAPYFSVRKPDSWLLVRRPCVLLQRTTSKEQSRRLIAAELLESFLRSNGAVTVENHLNMIVPIVDVPLVDTATVAAFLNSTAADRAFRCISGSVAVSAYELEAMPLPAPDQMKRVSAALKRKNDRSDVDRLCDQFYAST